MSMGTRTKKPDRSPSALPFGGINCDLPGSLVKDKAEQAASIRNWPLEMPQARLKVEARIAETGTLGSNTH